MKYRADIEDAEDRGKEKGKTEGEKRMARLIQLLLGEKKHEDINRALLDDSYRQTLFAVYGL